LNPDHLKDERYEELCALAAIGELSAGEFAELNEHLASCSNCQSLYFDFRRIASNEMGAVAAGRRVNDAGADLDQPALLSGVLERAQTETRFNVKPSDMRPTPRFLQSPMVSALSRLLRGPILAAAAIVLVSAAAAIATYQYRDRQLSSNRNQITPQLNVPPNGTETAAAQARTTAILLQQSRSEREALQRSLTQARRDYAELLSQRKAWEAELAASRHFAEKKADELQVAGNALQSSAVSVKELEARLQDALLRTQEQAGLLDQLKSRLHNAESEAAAATTPGAQDADAKEIFGARDLHMVDVYDVDASGKNKRGFGRVYFVEKKFLLFYAFDLQDKQRQRVAAAFQAWGYRQGNEGKPQNLGLFLMDDPAISRWVLKVNNARVLDHVDAVFVTLEPPNGSPAPSGRRLLYANLGGPPNHP
jgi:hypothetical protein